MSRRFSFLIGGGLTAALIVTAACNPPGSQRAASTDTSAAAKSYVAPGDKDEFYLFYSGGHSGQVYVAGLPSMRHITTIPVFAPYPATGYGFDEESKSMLGQFTWGDVHHPGLSQTDGKYDGRWLFVNDNANNRVARIDLRDFKTKQIFGPVPNVSGNHSGAFITPNSEYAMMGTRFSIPLPKGTYAPIEKYATEYKGVLAAVKIDPEDGEMTLGWQMTAAGFALQAHMTKAALSMPPATAAMRQGAEALNAWFTLMQTRSPKARKD